MSPVTAAAVQSAKADRLIVDLHAHPLLNGLYVKPGLQERSPVLPGPDRRLGFEALARGQVGVVVSSIYPFWSPARRSAYLDRCRDIIHLVEMHVAEHPASAVVVTEPAGIERALAQGKIAFIHAVEGGHVLEGRLENLDTLYRC